MSKYLAILILFSAGTLAHAQCQSCQSCQSCNQCQMYQDPGQCQSCNQQSCQPRVIFRPQPAPQPTDWQQPDEPQPAVNPPLPPPPAVETPAMPTAVPGPPGPQGPPGPKGDPATCDCGPKWTEINAQITAIKTDMAECKSTVTNLVSVVNQLKDIKPEPPKPFYIRVRNPKSGAVTEYAEVNQGQYVTIDLEPTSEPALVAPQPKGS